MAGLLTLVGALSGNAGSGFLADDQASMFLATVGENGEPDIRKAFQFWPAEMTDTHGSNYAVKVIPGGNLPLYQWTSGGERNIGFSVTFTRDLQGNIDSLGFGLPNSVAESKHNVDVAAAVKWLRSLKAPTYESDIVKPPPLLYLIAPGTPLGDNGEDNLLCEMTQCDVTWQKWFPDGTVRIATVALSFHESVQHPTKGTQFYGADKLSTWANKYNFTGY